VDCLSLRRLEQIRWVQAMKELHTTEPLFPPFLLTLPYDQNVSSSSSLTNIEDNTSWLANQNFRDPLDDNLVNNLKHVVAKTKSFQQDMENWYVGCVCVRTQLVFLFVFTIFSSYYFM